MAVAGYVTFGEKTQGNILNNYSHESLLMNLARLGFAFNMFTTFPLECFVCREVLHHLHDFPSPTHHPLPLGQHRGLTVLLVAISLLVSLTTCDLGLVLELTGGFSATALAFILPPACFLRLASGSVWTWSKLHLILCILGGVCVMVVSTVMTLQQALGSHHQKQCYW